MKKTRLILIIMGVIGVVNGWGQTTVSSAPPLTDEEIQTFKEISRYWNLGTLLIGLVTVFLLPILGFIIARTNFKNWFIPLVGENLMSKKEDLNEILEKMLEDFRLRKDTKILVVSDKPGVNLPMRNFLTEKGFSLSSIGDGFIELTQLSNHSLGGATLILFNYIGQDLSKVQNIIGDKVLSLKNHAKVVVVGNERMDAKYKESMGNYLTFSNGYDTLESRIIGAVKQPVA